MKNVTVLWTSGKSIVAIKGIHAMAFIFWVQFFRYESITEQGLSHFLYQSLGRRSIEEMGRVRFWH